MEPFIGEIRMFGGNFAPKGWAFCDGRLLSIKENGTLFSLLGTIYGGDGTSTFALPDLRGRTPIHANAGAGYPQGAAGGAERVSLTPTQFPAHTHAFYASDDPSDATAPGGNVIAESAAVRMYRAVAPDSAMAVGAIGPGVDPNGQPYGSASPQPHDNMQPYLCVNYIIALGGIFPPRD